jgi:thiol-disulfide isomerase/thioredoxin
VAKVAGIFAATGAESIASRLQAIAVEPDELLRQARSIALFATLEGSESEERAGLQSLARTTLQSLPANSPLWNAAPTSIVSMVSLAGSEYATRAEELVRRFVAEKEQELASNIALGMLVRAARAGDEDGVARYHQLITRELRNTDTAKLAQLFHPARKIRLGKALPDFSFNSADGPETFTNQSFRGKVLLIDFWATWCRPCMDELPNLHANYEQFHDAGFEILSINVDDKAGRSQEMRKRSQFPMPWSNVVLPRGRDQATKQRFEVAGLPTMILVNGEGKILATGPFVRGPAMERQVRAALAAQKVRPASEAR